MREIRLRLRESPSWPDSAPMWCGLPCFFTREAHQTMVELASSLIHCTTASTSERGAEEVRISQ
jgi:hypothetical protein